MIKTKADLKRYLAMDQMALDRVGKRPKLFGDWIWKYEIVLRKHEYYLNCKRTAYTYFMRKIYGWLHYHKSMQLGLQIPCNVCGGGLRINHYGLIVIDDNAVIGDWCDIHQAVNIGQSLERGVSPKLGSNVWIGPGAKLFGNIVIGDNTMIGAGAVVNKSFPEGNCRIAGVPARVISNEPNVYKRSM